MIVGDKVLICGLTHDSVSEIYEWINQPELKELTGTVYPVSEFEHESWVERRALSSTDKLFLIKEKDTSTDIGTIGIKNIDWVNRNAELFISLGNLKYMSQISGGGKQQRIWK